MNIMIMPEHHNHEVRLGTPSYFQIFQWRVPRRSAWQVVSLASDPSRTMCLPVSSTI